MIEKGTEGDESCEVRVMRNVLYDVRAFLSNLLGAGAS